MRKKMFVLASVFVMAGTLTFAYATDVDKGKALFASPTLGGGTTGKSCMTCHDGGEGFDDDLFDRKSYTIMGMEKKSVEEIVNVCIEKPLGGVAIDPASDEMGDLVAYMKTLVAK